MNYLINIEGSDRQKLKLKAGSDARMPFTVAPNIVLKLAHSYPITGETRPLIFLSDLPMLIVFCKLLCGGR